MTTAPTLRAGAALLAALALAGCLGPGTTTPPRFFVLSAVEATPPAASPREGPALGVGPVSFPDWLDRPQLVTRVGANEVRLAEFAHWAEPLDETFTRVLATNLARLVPTERVAVYPWSRSTQIDARVEMQVLHFEAATTGDVTLEAVWRLLRGDGREITPARRSLHVASAGSDAPDAVVAAMSRALAALSRELAAAIAAR